ncbi:MAG TPA: PEGA domain-containing protein [Kofleriaceae bacterium]|nr:PEGA domain-containing protein [Kofleriaceae bacterium]
MGARAGLAALLTMSVAAGGAAAQPKQSGDPGARTIGLFKVEVAGGGSDELRGQVSAALAAAVTGAGATLVGEEKVDAIVSRDKELASCLSATCLEKLGAKVGVKELLRAHIAASGNIYELDLELLSPAAEGGLAGRVQRTCSVCTVTELSQMVATAASDLLAGRADGGVDVEIVCKPHGAEIAIDDQPKGPGPLKVRLAPGRHRVVARLDGHTNAFKVIEVSTTAGDQRFELVLAPAGVLGDDRRPYRTLKWVTAGSAAAALVAGAVLLVVDGNGTCGGGDEQCPMEYDTRAAGLLGLAVGVAAGGASAWMFARDTP